MCKYEKAGQDLRAITNHSRKNKIILRLCSSTIAHAEIDCLKHTKTYNAFLLAGLCLLIISSCTTRKDGFAYRVFHNTTAKYNGYFYAKESLKEGRATLQKNFKEDYDEILPVFVYGDEATAQTIYPQMERTIEKSSRVIERHNMEAAGRNKKAMKRPELNKWIDDNYLLIGVAYFYKQNYFKAEELFLFVSRKYKEDEMQAKSSTWLARTYLERQQYTKSKNMLLKASQMKGLEDEVLADVYLTYADFHIRQGDLKEAKEKLEYALRYIKKKKEKARPTFILAQINQALNKSQEAIDLYETVLTLRPTYEMEFYARINQAMAFDRKGGNSSVIKERLFKMLKDEKNIEYKDQIYYALATIELEERNRDQGIAYLEESLDANTTNKKQKVKSFLKLADLYLDDRIYPTAQAYYDSTFNNIDELHPRYNDIKNKAESLTDLVENLDVIYYEDSVQRICDLDEVDRVIKAQGIINAIRSELEAKEAEKERLLAELAAAEGPGGVGQFWPYNPQLKAIGQQNFKDSWGDRPLEDNWRRGNKLQQSFNETDETVESIVEEKPKTDNIEDQLPTVEELLANLPCDEARRTESNSRLAEAYYNAGVVYKEKLEDLDNATEKWEVLTNRFEDSDFHPTTYYQLYRTYLFREQEQAYTNPFCGTCNSGHWAQIILNLYPGSEWAILVENPDYQDIVELEQARAEEAYGELYQAYNYRQYQDVINESTRVLAEEPDNHLLCKYRILKAFAVGNLDAFARMDENYKKELQEVISGCPDTEEATFAQNILKKLNQGEQVIEQPEDIKDEVPNQELFQTNMSAKHYFALIYPVSEGNVNEMKATISDFNKAYFQTGALKISSNLLDKNNQVILVKTFNRIEDAQDYYRTFTGNEKELTDINKSGFTTILISKDNYVTLFKTKELEAYVAFFNNQYTF